MVLHFIFLHMIHKLIMFLTLLCVTYVYCLIVIFLYFISFKKCQIYAIFLIYETPLFSWVGWDPVLCRLSIFETL